MGACMDAGFAYFEVGIIGVDCKYCVAGVVGDSVVGISGKVI